MQWFEFASGSKDYVLNTDHPTNESPEEIWSKVELTAQLFRESNYTSTASIAHYWLYKQNLDAILYPSVQNNRWCNFALHPRFADTLKLYNVLACRWTGKNFEFYYVGTEDVNGNLTWRDFTQSDHMEFETGYKDLLTK